MPEPASRGRNPFDTTGVERGDDGIKRYAGRPSSLVHMLRATVDRDRDATAVAEVGGESLTYGELWDRASRVAGGLRAAGVERGDRAAILLPNGVDWVLAFWGAQLAGAVAVPVNTRFTEQEVDYVVKDSGAAHVFRPGDALPDGEPLVTDDLAPGDLAAIFYTSGTTGLPEGRDDVARELPRQHRERVSLRRRRPGRGPVAGDAHQRPAVPRHRLQQPAARAARARRPRVHPHQPARPRGLPAHGHRGGRADAHLGARDLPRADPPSALRRCRPRPRALGELRRRADRRRRGAQDHGRVPVRAGGQRLRADRDVVADVVPAPRGGGRARRQRRLRDAGRRRRGARARRRDRRRRAARARRERRARLLEQARGQRGDVRRRLAAHRRPRAHRRRRADLHRRPRQGHDQPRRRERVLDRGRVGPGRRARRRRGRGRPRARRHDGREGRRGHRARRRRARRPGRRSTTCARRSPTSRSPSTSRVREEPLPRNPGGKVLKKQLREETEWGEPLR